MRYRNLLVQGDAANVLRDVEDQCVDLTVTSPPYYNARDYAHYPSYEAYLAQILTVLGEVHRVTKPGRFLALNTSPVLVAREKRSKSSTRYGIPFDLHYHLVRNGWDFIEDILWVKPEASAINRNAGFDTHRQPLAYKANPCVEYIFVYRKHTEKLIDATLREYAPDDVESSLIRGEYQRSNVWQIDPVHDPKHPATFPVELPLRLIQYYSIQNSLILDPYAGTGTVGQAAKTLNRYYFLIERDARYAQTCALRLGQMSLFAPLPLRFMHEADFITA